MRNFARVHWERRSQTDPTPFYIIFLVSSFFFFFSTLTNCQEIVIAMSHLWCAENIFFFLNCFCTIPRETSGLVVCPRTSCDNLFLVISKYKLYKTNARCAIRSKQYLCSYCLVVLGDQKSIQCTHTFSSRLTSQRCQCFFCKVQMAVSQVQGLSLSSAMSHFFFSQSVFCHHIHILCVCA